MGAGGRNDGSLLFCSASSWLSITAVVCELLFYSRHDMIVEMHYSVPSRSYFAILT